MTSAPACALQPPSPTTISGRSAPASSSRTRSRSAAPGARPAGDEADAGTARELPVGLRHVRRAALVAAHDEPDVGVVEGVEDREVALPRHAEGELGAVEDELVDEQLRAGAAHRVTGC